MRLLRDYLRALRRHVWLVLVTGAGGVLTIISFVADVHVTRTVGLSLVVGGIVIAQFLAWRESDAARRQLVDQIEQSDRLSMRLPYALEYLVETAGWLLFQVRQCLMTNQSRTEAVSLSVIVSASTGNGGFILHEVPHGLIPVDQIPQLGLLRCPVNLGPQQSVSGTFVLAFPAGAARLVLPDSVTNADEAGAFIRDRTTRHEMHVTNHVSGTVIQVPLPGNYP